MAPASGSQPIESRAAARVGVSPFAFEPTLLLEAVERRVERAVFDLQCTSRALFNPTQRRQSVHRAPRESAEDHQIEGAADDVELGRCAHDGELQWPANRVPRQWRRGRASILSFLVYARQ